MSIIEAIILGVVQGLTEFLPVSSSGHLVLLQKIFGISQDALLFDTMVHVGTLAAVFAVLWKDIWSILKNPIQPLTGYLILATIPAVIVALIFKDAIEAAFASASFLGIAFLLTSAALLVSDFLSTRKGEPRGQGKMNALDAVIIGAMQAIAIIPGVSRSGFTLSGALSRKLERDFAARFSFLLSIPAILGALVLQIKDIAFNAAAATGAAMEAAIPAIGFTPIAVGTITAALVGFFSVKLMLRIVRGHRLWGFAIYTGAVGIGLLLLG
jgi:undecaprenyl-diphosphatase